MKLSIRMKIFLPVMFLLIAFPVAAWFVFSYALDGHMNYNAKRDLGQMVKTVEELTEEYSNVNVPMRFSADIRGFTGKIFYPEMAFRGPRICLCERCFLRTRS